jgi:hypothetical protein
VLRYDYYRDKKVVRRCLCAFLLRRFTLSTVLDCYIPWSLVLPAVISATAEQAHVVVHDVP